jgi:hypothetical protein
MAKANYTDLEQAVVNKLIAHFDGLLNEKSCRAGDLDGVLEAVFETSAEYGCILEFDGGREESRSPFDKLVWVWSIIGVFLIRYDGVGVEAKMRDAVNRLAMVFDKDHTLGGATVRVRIAEISKAEPAAVNDIAFYWLPFRVEIIDR